MRVAVFSFPTDRAADAECRLVTEMESMSSTDFSVGNMHFTCSKSRVDLRSVIPYYLDS